MTTPRAFDALFGKTRRALLALLFGHPEQSFYTREIVSRVAAGTSQVQRELDRLARAGLLLREPRGRRVYFRANPDAALFADLVGLSRKLDRHEAESADPPAHRRPRSPAASAGVFDAHAPKASPGPAVAWLSPAQRAAIARIARAHGLQRVSLFGSATHGPLSESGDVDLLIEFRPGRRPSLWDLPALQEELATIFGRRVDLATPDILENPYRRAAILRDLRPLYAA